MSARTVRAFAGGLLTGLLGTLIAVILLPVAIGWRPYTVLTGSMRPVIDPGDVVMTRPVAPTTLDIDDVVTFPDPSRGGKLVTHRVRSLNRQGPVIQVETRGDANPVSERWSVAADGRVGRVVFVLPRVGHAGDAIRTPGGLLALVVIPALALGALALRWIWREEEPGADDQGAAAPPDR